MYRWLMLTGLVAVLGCGGPSCPIAPVSGQVTLDGRPLADAHVTFQPIALAGRVNAGAGSVGVTDAEGRFALRTVEPERSGAVVGKHHVWITTAYRDDPHDDFSRPEPDRVPPRYQRGSLTFEVLPGGTDQADFHLSSSSQEKTGASKAPNGRSPEKTL